MTEIDLEHIKKSLVHIVWADQTYEEYKHLVSSLITTIESQKEEIAEFKQALTPSVVYSAIRHYYKQGLFDPDEYGDIENIMDLISRLKKGKNT